MTTPKFAVIMPEIFFGGAETQFRKIVEGLANLDVELTVYVERSYRKSKRDEDDAFMRRLEPLVRFVCLRGLRTQHGNLQRVVSSIRFRAQMRGSISQNEYDAILVYSGLGAQAIIIAKRVGIRTVFSERNSGAYGSSGWISKGRFIRHAHSVAANSPAAVQELAKRRISAELVLNGIPAAQFKTQSRRRFAEDGLRILVPARIARVKGQSTVMAAVEQLPPIVSHITFAGATEDATFLAELAREARLAKGGVNFEFAGHVQDMAACYASADIVVLSSFSEGMPNVLLESMLAGTICIASDIPSNRFVIRNDELLFNPGDAEGLATAIRYVRDLDFDMRENLAVANRKWVELNFSTTEMVDRYFGLLAGRNNSSCGPPPSVAKAEQE